MGLNFEATKTLFNLAKEEIVDLKAKVEKLKTAKDKFQLLVNNGEMRRYLYSRKNKKLRKALKKVAGNFIPGYGICWCWGDRREVSFEFHEDICKAAKEALIRLV